MTTMSSRVADGRVAPEKGEKMKSRTVRRCYRAAVDDAVFLRQPAGSRCPPSMSRSRLVLHGFGSRGQVHHATVSRSKRKEECGAFDVRCVGLCA